MGRKARPVRPDPKGHREALESKDRMAQPDLRDPPGPPDPRGRRDIPETKDRQAQQEPRDPQVLLDPKGQRDCVALPGQLESRDLTDLRVSRANRGYPACKSSPLRVLPTVWTRRWLRNAGRMTTLPSPEERPCPVPRMALR